MLSNQIKQLEKKENNKTKVRETKRFIHKKSCQIPSSNIKLKVMVYGSGRICVGPFQRSGCLILCSPYIF